jgi:hypothetical protein
MYSLEASVMIQQLAEARCSVSRLHNTNASSQTVMLRTTASMLLYMATVIGAIMFFISQWDIATDI